MATHALPSSRITASHFAPTGAALAPSRLYIAVLVSQMRRAQREIDRKLGPGAWDRVKRINPPPER